MKSGGPLPAGQHRRSLALPVVFGAESFELCPHRRKPALEDTHDLTADLGCREGGSVYKPTPAIDLILRADDDFIGIAAFPYMPRVADLPPLCAGNPRTVWPDAGRHRIRQHRRGVGCFAGAHAAAARRAPREI